MMLGPGTFAGKLQGSARHSTAGVCSRGVRPGRMSRKHLGMLHELGLFYVAVARMVWGQNGIRYRLTKHER